MHRLEGETPETGGLKQRAELGVKQRWLQGTSRELWVLKLDEERPGWGRKCSWLQSPHSLFLLNSCSDQIRESWNLVASPARQSAKPPRRMMFHNPWDGSQRAA